MPHLLDFKLSTHVFRGVGIIYLILHLLTNLLAVRCGFKGYESGQYGDPPRFTYWLRQTAVYVLSLTTMKLTVVSLFAIWPGVFHVGEWLLSWLGTNEALQVILYVPSFSRTVKTTTKTYAARWDCSR